MSTTVLHSRCSLLRFEYLPLNLIIFPYPRRLPMHNHISHWYDLKTQPFLYQPITTNQKHPDFFYRWKYIHASYKWIQLILDAMDLCVCVGRRGKWVKKSVGKKKKYKKVKNNTKNIFDRKSFHIQLACEFTRLIYLLH